MPYTQLRGYNEVANLDLRQLGATGGQFASLASQLFLRCILRPRR